MSINWTPILLLAMVLGFAASALKDYGERAAMRECVTACGVSEVAECEPPRVVCRVKP